MSFYTCNVSYYGHSCILSGQLRLSLRNIGTFAHLHWSIIDCTHSGFGGTAPGPVCAPTITHWIFVKGSLSDTSPNSGSMLTKFCLKSKQLNGNLPCPVSVVPYQQLEALGNFSRMCSCNSDTGF